MKTLHNLMAWAMMLIATMSAASCSDNDNDETVPAGVATEMAGTYQSLITYGNNLCTSAMTVTLTPTEVTFAIPVREILPSVMKAEDGLEEAQQTVLCNSVTAAHTPLRYHSSVATFVIANQTVNFTYSIAGKKHTGSVTITTPSIAYNTSTHKMSLGFTVDTVSLDRANISGYEKREIYMQESEKKY